METTVEEFEGVEQAYVIKSGREVRAMVSPNVMDDEAVTLLAKSVAKRLRSDLHQSSNIKVTSPPSPLICNLKYRAVIAAQW